MCPLTDVNVIGGHVKLFAVTAGGTCMRITRFRDSQITVHLYNEKKRVFPERPVVTYESLNFDVLANRVKARRKEAYSGDVWTGMEWLKGDLLHDLSSFVDLVVRRVQRALCIKL